MNRQVDWFALTVARPLQSTDGAFEAVREVEAGRHGEIDGVTVASVKEISVMQLAQGKTVRKTTLMPVGLALKLGTTARYSLLTGQPIDDTGGVMRGRKWKRHVNSPH